MEGAGVSKPVAVIACTGMTLFYVVTLYAPTLIFGLQPAHSFKEFMIRRFVCAAVSSVVSVVVCALILPVSRLCFLISVLISGLLSFTVGVLSYVSHNLFDGMPDRKLGGFHFVGRLRHEGRPRSKYRFLPEMDAQQYLLKKLCAFSTEGVEPSSIVNQASIGWSNLSYC